MRRQLFQTVIPFAQQHRYALSAIAISFTLYLLLFINWAGELGGLKSTSPRLEALIAIGWSLLPFIWLTCLFILGSPWLKGVSACGFFAFGTNVFVTVLAFSSTIVSDRDDMRHILAIKRIDDRSNLVTYRVDDVGTSATYRQEWMEKKILPGIIWCKKLSSHDMY